MWPTVCVHCTKLCTSLSSTLNTAAIKRMPSIKKGRNKQMSSQSFPNLLKLFSRVSPATSFLPHFYYFHCIFPLPYRLSSLCGTPNLHPTLMYVHERSIISVFERNILFPFLLIGGKGKEILFLKNHIFYSLDACE